MPVNVPPTAADQKILIPTTTLVEGKPNYRKLQAVEVNAGMEALVKWTMKSPNGDPVDLTDAVAEALNKPFAALSLEMVYRGLYHFTQAFHRGQATDPVAYLTAKAKWLGIIKRKRKRSPLELLDLTNPLGP